MSAKGAFLHSPSDAGQVLGGKLPPAEHRAGQAWRRGPRAEDCWGGRTLLPASPWDGASVPPSHCGSGMVPCSSPAEAFSVSAGGHETTRNPWIPDSRRWSQLHLGSHLVSVLLPESLENQKCTAWDGMFLCASSSRRTRGWLLEKAHHRPAPRGLSSPPVHLALRVAVACPSCRGPELQPK